MQVADRRMIASVGSMILVLAVLDPDVTGSVHDDLTHWLRSCSRSSRGGGRPRRIE